MWQAKLTAAKQPLKLVQVPIPEPPPKGLLLKTAYAGICHSDLHLIKDAVNIGDDTFVHHSEVLALKGFKFEGVPGHEISGTIVKFGSEANPEEHGLKKGDAVSMFSWMGCGDCDTCKNDASNHCTEECNGVEGGYGLNWCGALAYTDGGYQEYIRVPHCRYALKLPDSIPLDVGAMIPCSGVTSYSALQKASPFVEIALRRRSHARVMVMGVGGVGLWAVGLTKAIYKGKSVEVIAADIGQNKLDMAIEAGADHGVLLGRDDDINTSVGKIRELGKMDAILDFVGSEATAAISISCLEYNGTYIPVGLAGGKLSYPLPAIIVKSLAIQGTIVANLLEHRELIQLLQAHKVMYPKTEYYKLAECNEALDKLRAGKINGRALLKFEWK